MNRYPIWWEDTLTIYNKYEDPTTNLITWYRTVVKNCFWKYTGDKVTIGESVLETNDTICRIPKSSKFKNRYQWVSVPNDQKGRYFTLGTGDIIVKGNVTDTINEYSKGYRSTDLIAKYKNLQGCIEITQYSVNVGAGRVNEHYFVKGV